MQQAMVLHLAQAMSHSHAHSSAADAAKQGLGAEPCHDLWHPLGHHNSVGSKPKVCVRGRETREQLGAGLADLAVGDDEDVCQAPFFAFQPLQAAPQHVVHLCTAVKRVLQEVQQLRDPCRAEAQLKLSDVPRPTVVG